MALEFQIINPSEDGFLKKIEFNHEEIKTEVTKKVADYKSLVYTEDTIRVAKTDVATLRKFKAVLRRELLASWGRQLKQYLEGEGLRCADFFVGAALSGEMDLLNLENALRHIANECGDRDMLAEVMLHPGYIRKTSSGNSRYAAAHQDAGRNRELDMLLSDSFTETVEKYATFFRKEKPKKDKLQ